jgi:DNA-binding SARP family transcriptional activator/Tfp pilus assembly protein PilF
MESKITYHQQISYCGKSECRRCREGIGHGPYWYAYKVVNGQTVRTYIGKNLPPDRQVSSEHEREAAVPSVRSSELEEATIRIYTLGQFRLERRDGLDWQTVTEAAWQHQRVRSLLGCLVSGPMRKLGREQLMDAIWPELDSETAAGRLDRAVHSLRQLFEPSRSRPATSPLLLTERDVVALAEQAQVWIDADTFEALLNQARSSTDPGEKWRLLEEAAVLYGGEFLPEERKIELIVTRREFLLRSWIGLLLELADLRAPRDLNSAIDPLDRILAIDPTNEAAAQRLIKLLAQLDRRGEALRVYKRLASILQQEYHIAPLPETRALYDAVRLRTKEQMRTTGTTTNKEGMATPASQDDYREATTTSQIGRTHQSPLVGREKELTLLQGLLGTVEHTAKFKLPGQKKTSSLPLDTRRSPQSILLMGDVGIGKTRLAEEIAREGRRRGWAVAWSRVYPQEISIPYRLWTEVLRKAMEQGTWQRQELGKHPLTYYPLTALLPELDGLLTRVALPAPQSPEQEQLHLWEAACELMSTISEGSPLLVVLDDMQWADSSSCELFAYLARRLNDLPIVIVGTCRENELGPQHPLWPLLTDLQREHTVELISLQPLSDEQIAMIVSHIPHVTEPVVQYIQTRAAGNPFFAEELARTMESFPGRDQFVVPGHLGNSVPVLPDTISAALNLRLSRLSSACQRLLSKAAVLGSSFEFHLISAMEANTPGFNEDSVLDLVEEALQAGMLTEEGTGTRITYQFWHPLLVTHLYESLSAARRGSFHRRAAEILQQEYQGREEEAAATITHHLVNSGAPLQQIAHYAELAGNCAYTLSAYPDAERYYRLAVEHFERIIHQTPQPTPDDRLHLAYLLEFLGECTRLQGKYEEARHIYERTLEVRRQSDILGSEQLSQEEAQIQGILWCEIGLTWYYTSDNAQARQYCERGEQVLREAGVLAGAAWARLHFLQGYIHWSEGNYEEARRSAQEALKLFEAMLNQQEHSPAYLARSTRLRRALAGDPVELGRTYALLGLVSTSAGQPVEAAAHWSAALTLFEQYDLQREIAVVCCNLGDVHLRRAEYGSAQSFLRRSLTIAERIGELPLVCVIFNNLGVLAARVGDLVEAEALYKKALALAERINDPISMSILHAYLTSVLQDQGKFGEARANLYQSLSISRTMGITPCVGFALIALGSLRTAQAILDEGSKENGTLPQGTVERTLKRARKALQHALALEGMEAETRTEGQLVLAQVELLLGKVESAQQRAAQMLEEARRYELTWLIARAQRILGSIFTELNQWEEARKYFEQALSTFCKSNMRLGYARTLREYGVALVRYGDTGKLEQREYKRGIEYLREAHSILTDCNAALEARVLERELSRYKRAIEK